MKNNLFEKEDDFFKLKSIINLDKNVKKLSKNFDYDFNGVTYFNLPRFSKTPNQNDFSIGVVCGNSGSGKTQMMKKYYNYKEKKIKWKKRKAVISHFEYNEGLDRLFAAGLSSIPNLCKSYNVLSNGEKYRADVARQLKNNVIIDEFTSVINRKTAYAVCVGISKYIRRKNLKGIIFISCHMDIIDWIEPDWVYNTNTKSMDINSLNLELFPVLGEYEI